MEIKLIGDSKIIMENPNSVHNYFAWPSVTRLQNGKIAAVASGYRLEHICPFGKAVIAYSEDEGETYTRPAPVIDTYLDDRDAGICTFGESGAILTSFNNSVEQQRIWNNSGWMLRKEKERAYRTAYLDMVPQEGEKKFLGSTFCISYDCGVTFGKIHKCPVTSPHGPCVLQDGTILWVGTWFDRKDDEGNEKKITTIRAYKINLDGTTEYVGEIENCEFEDANTLSCEPHAIQLNDGTIVCHIRVQCGDAYDGVFTIYQSESQDGGKTWTKPHQIIGKTDGAPAHLLQLSSGRVISVYCKRLSPRGIKVMVSDDNCKTWDTDHDIYINDISWDIGYPATVELKDGSLLTVFYAHPAHGAPAVIMQQKWKIEE